MMARCERTGPVPARLTLEQLAEAIIGDYRSDGRSVHNPKQVFRMLRDDLGITMAAELEGKIVERFKAACENANLSIDTANTRVATLNKIRRRSLELGFIRKHEPLPTTTASRFKARAKRSTPPPDDNVQRLLAYLQSNATDFKGRRLYTLVSIVYSLGLECAGLIRSRISEAVDLDAGTIRIIRPWRGRGKPTPPRYYEMDNGLRSLVADWKREVMCDWFFPGSATRSLGHEASVERVLRLCSKMHALRRGLRQLPLRNFVVTARSARDHFHCRRRKVAPLSRNGPRLLWAMRAKWRPSAGRRSPS